LIDLLDADVWISLTAPDHAHHGRARRFWFSEAADRVAFCRVTSLALLRLLTNPHVMRQGVHRSAQAWAVYSQLLELPEIVFMREPATVQKRFGQLASSNELQHGRWTDAYLAAFAIEGNCRLVTFDRGFGVYRDLRWLLLEA
jgi:toxin-antitoxin system PIN domain toxin